MQDVAFITIELCFIELLTDAVREVPKSQTQGQTSHADLTVSFDIESKLGLLTGLQTSFYKKLGFQNSYLI